MRKNGIRLPILATIHAVIFILVATTAPSEPNTHNDRSAPPDLEELAILDELADWVGCPSESGSACLGQQPLRKAIRTRPASFELFRHYHDEESRKHRLEGLPFGTLIREAAEQNGVDALLVAAVVAVESSFDPSAVSIRGAVGLMQVRPSSVADATHDLLLEPKANLEAGSAYLRQLLGLYEGDLELALAAYNAGPTNVRRYGGVPPFRETREYVEKVLKLYVEHHRELWRSSETGELLALL